jgi:hypothetical protein
MRANMVLRIFKAVRDAIRIDRAFSAAAQNRNDEALRALGGLGEDAKKLYDVKLLKGALYSLLNMHDQAVDELASAAQQIKASRRFSKAEANYLVRMRFSTGSTPPTRSA